MQLHIGSKITDKYISIDFCIRRKANIDAFWWKTNLQPPANCLHLQAIKIHIIPLQNDSMNTLTPIIFFNNVVNLNLHFGDFQYYV